MLSWCQATFSEADVLALQIIAARMSTSLMRVRAVLAQMWHGCAGTDRRMSRLHWRPPRAGARALPRGMHTRRPRAIAPNPSSSGRKPGRPSPPTRCADVCDRSPPPRLLEAGQCGTAWGRCMRWRKCKPPWSAPSTSRTSRRCARHVGSIATYAAACALRRPPRRRVGQCCQSPSAALWLFLRGVWRMVQLSSNVHRATRKPSSLQRAMRNMQLT